MSHGIIHGTDHLEECAGEAEAGSEGVAPTCEGEAGEAAEAAEAGSSGATTMWVVHLGADAAAQIITVGTETATAVWDGHVFTSRSGCLDGTAVKDCCV